MGLSSHDLEKIVDGQIEVRLRKTKTENEEWISFNENWRFVYPFNLLLKEVVKVAKTNLNAKATAQISEEISGCM